MEQQDRARARELYKYFNPTLYIHSASKFSTPDTVLTAHSQLVAWRLGAQRGMVSFLDKEVQYFVAESTKTLNLEDSSQYDDPIDAIWAGVSHHGTVSVSRALRHVVCGGQREEILTGPTRHCSSGHTLQN